MAEPKEVNDGQFESEVLKAEVPVLVDFWAPWCGPCNMVAPITEELAEEYEGKVKFVKVNVDENPSTAGSYGIRAIPTLLVFKGGSPLSEIVGVRPKAEFKKHLDAAVE